MTMPPPRLRRRACTSTMPAPSQTPAQALRRPGAPERADARPEEAADLGPARRDGPAGEREPGPDPGLPGGTRQRPRRHGELEHGDLSSGPDDPRELPHRRGRVVHVAEEVGEGQPGEASVLEGQLLGPPLAELDAIGEAGGRHAAAALGQHLRALVDADDAAAEAARDLDRDRAGPAGDVEDGVAGAGVDAGHEERAPARVLPEAEEVGVAVVRPRERREELAGGAVPLGGWSDHLAIVAPREPRGGAERRK